MDEEQTFPPGEKLDTLPGVRGKPDRSDFLLAMAPLRPQGGTGCPVNPIAIF
jgi:kynurenine formamidase